MGPAHTFETVSRRPPDVEDYIDIVRRYRSWIIGPTFAGLVIATVIAFLWPDTYVSTAVLRITPQQVSERLVPSATNVPMFDRLQQMQTAILSHTTLAEIIQKPTLELYKKEWNKIPMEDIVQSMRNKSIRITMMGDAKRGGAAFQVSFSYTDRYKAQLVVRELVTRFMDQNMRVQRDQVSLTTTFLNDELKGAREKMDKLDEEISKFKRANAGKLPEQAQANAQALQTYILQLMDRNAQVNRATQDKLLLESQLTSIKNQESAASVNLNETIPASISAPLTVQNQKLIQLNSAISTARSNLAAMREKLGNSHPDVAEAQAVLQSFEKDRDELEKRESAQTVQTPGATTAARVVTNPLVARQIDDLRASAERTRSQVVAKEMEIQELNRSRAELEKIIAVYQKRLEDAPLNEQQYNSLLRESNMAKVAYEEMSKRHVASETAQSMEEHKAGENLEVLDAASLPEQAAEPNRVAWAGLGVAVGLAIGLILAAAQEVRNTSLKNLKDVRAYTNLPVLSSIPLLENALLVRRKRRLVWLAWSSAVIVGSILMTGSMYYHLTGI
jgi:succinoglycan biosynthesis transport protein ExoP